MRPRDGGRMARGRGRALSDPRLRAVRRALRPHRREAAILHPAHAGKHWRLYGRPARIDAYRRRARELETELAPAAARLLEGAAADRGSVLRARVAQLSGTLRRTGSRSSSVSRLNVWTRGCGGRLPIRRGGAPAAVSRLLPWHPRNGSAATAHRDGRTNHRRGSASYAERRSCRSKATSASAVVRTGSSTRVGDRLNASASSAARPSYRSALPSGSAAPRIASSITAPRRWPSASASRAGHPSCPSTRSSASAVPRTANRAREARPSPSATGAGALPTWKPRSHARANSWSGGRHDGRARYPSSRPTCSPDLARRAGRADFDRLRAQLRSSGYCARPVRLAGQIETCDANGVRRVWSTDNEPDGVLRKACGNRREAVCPPLRRALPLGRLSPDPRGHEGGKGVPDTVAGHPAVFFTLTAPSFGPVHTRPLGADGEPRRCRPRRDGPCASTASPLSCGKVHAEDDPCLGEPLCGECFDHRAGLVWNNTLAKLWRARRSTCRARSRAEQTHPDQAAAARAPFNYVKVAEYQRRGLVHLHVHPARSRHAQVPRGRAAPADGAFTSELLERAVRATVETVDAPVGEALGGGRVGWGPSSTSAASTTARRAARSPGTSPSTRPRAPNRPAACRTA